MKTILVVEDFIAVQLFLRETLESQGYRTFGASNGNRAYEILLNHFEHINLIITDYHMPDSTGYDLVKRIKENSNLEKIPIIFLTAETDPKIISMVEEVSSISWIRKPYRSEVLIGQVKNLLQQCRS